LRLSLKSQGRTIALTPKHELKEGWNMLIHLLTCLALTALTTYVVALRFFDLAKVSLPADEDENRVMAQAN
jgi:hypothetical protein